MRIVNYKNILLENLEIGQSQARTRDINKNIDELAASIAAIGLLEPIVVAPLGDDKYEIITGQRRFLACEKLQLPAIMAGVLDERPDGDLAKAISLTENMVREDMPTKDYIDACTELYRRYGTIKAVSEELGLPYPKVSQYVKFDQLIEPLKESVKKGQIDMRTALLAQKAATTEGDISEDTAVMLADEMRSLAGEQQKALVKAAEAQPGATAEEIIEAGRKQQRIKKLTITIGDEMDTALATFAQEEGTNREEAASLLIESGLSQRGYTNRSLS